MASSCEPLRLLQITDPHLLADPEGTLLGVRTRETFEAVLSHVRANHEQPHAVLATGDISQDGSDEAYRYFLSQTAFFDCPVFWFNGNHDHGPAMEQIIGGTESAAKRYRSHGWQLVFLDSSVPDQVHGHLSDAELAMLDEALSEYPDDHALICLHHHPVEVSARWMNAIGLRNHERFFEVVDRHPQVRGILWGHIHQDLDEQRDGQRLLATPSTSVQFAPDVTDFRVDDRPPGYRWLNLYPDGRIETGVERIAAGDFGLELDSSGY